MLLSLLLTLLAARAESPGTLPGGAAVVYTGAGVTTFNRLTQDGEVQLRDREVRLRGDLYGSVGLTDRLQLSASAPLVASFVVDNPDELPCPGLLQSEGYCDSYVTVGQGRAELRYGVRRGAPWLTLGAAADVDRWNHERRGQYNSAGSGRTVLEGLAVVGAETGLGGWAVRGLVLGAYGRSLGPEVSSSVEAGSGQDPIVVQAPGDTVRGSVEVRGHRDGLAVELGGHVVQRLSGVDLDGDWVQDWFLTSQDRWNVLRYRGVAVSGKVSLELPGSSGLHVGAHRLVAVDNGASNTTDVSVGWHRYFAPRER